MNRLFMNEKVMSLSLCLFIAITLSSCEPFLTVNQSTLVFDETGGTQTILVSGNKVWIANSSQSWCQINPSSGKGSSCALSVTCDINRSLLPRTCNITIESDDVSTMIIVNQAEADPFVVFNDSVFEQYCLERYDHNKDGGISYSEASKILRIRIYDNDHISSLKGIEHMTNLEELVCTGTEGPFEGQPGGKLTQLDISKNTALTSLNCSNNQINQLDVSNNTALQKLYCRRNNLSSLNISNNKALTDLDCSYNPLTYLGVYNNTELIFLSCFYTHISSLDVSCNSKLKNLACMQCPYLTTLWLKTGQKIQDLYISSSITTIKYKD